MTEEQSNTQLIQSIYEAFGRGDIPAILDRCSTEAEFSFEGGSPAVPWHGPWRGHAALGQFFATISDAVEFQSFEPRDFTASSSAVAVLVRLRYRGRAKGKVVDQMQVHWWSLRAGKVATLKHHEDTAQVLAAVRK